MKKTLQKSIVQKLLQPKEFAPFGCILIYIELISFSFLSSYPWVSVGDEVRDGGWQAMQIAQGTLTNIFAYGRYDAHGLIIPTITSFFYFLFGGTTLTFRFPSALLACADVLVLYVLIRLLYNKTAAFFGAVILASFPWHIFYARTQVVDSFTNFWTSVLFLFFFVLLKKKRRID
ncbi:MAG: glycosyltransferase family 39 protein, partial [Patescibacteria group bacterium]|nr:glycosyltransferase family 39 protein [Patescibacteria group bacterium]